MRSARLGTTMSSKRFLNGVKWLKEHGFTALDDEQDEPCYRWTRDIIYVCYWGSEWCASASGWRGDCGTTPKAALSRMHEAFKETRDSFLKQAQECAEIVEYVGKALEKEN